MLPFVQCVLSSRELSVSVVVIIHRDFLLKEAVKPLLFQMDQNGLPHIYIIRLGFLVYSNKIFKTRLTPKSTYKSRTPPNFSLFHFLFFPSPPSSSFHTADDQILRT
jgi:hypothetical protein